MSYARGYGMFVDYSIHFFYSTMFTQLNEKSTDNLRIVFWLICVLIKLDTQFIFDKKKFSYHSNLMNSDCLEKYW